MLFLMSLIQEILEKKCVKMEIKEDDDIQKDIKEDTEHIPD